MRKTACIHTDGNETLSRFIQEVAFDNGFSRINGKCANHLSSQVIVLCSDGLLDSYPYLTDVPRQNTIHNGKTMNMLSIRSLCREIYRPISFSIREDCVSIVDSERIIDVPKDVIVQIYNQIKKVE